MVGLGGGQGVMPEDLAQGVRRGEQPGGPAALLLDGGHPRSELQGTPR